MNAELRGMPNAPSDDEPENAPAQDTQSEDLTQVYRRARRVKATKQEEKKSGMARIPSWIQFVASAAVVIALHLSLQLYAAEHTHLLAPLQWLDRILIAGLWVAVGLIAFFIHFASGVLFVVVAIFPIKYIMTASITPVEIAIVTIAMIYLLYLIFFRIKSGSAKGLYVGLMIALTCEMSTLGDWSFLLDVEEIQKEHAADGGSQKSKKVGKAHVDVFGL